MQVITATPYTSLRDAIVTVKNNLLGATFEDAVVWLRKHTHPPRESFTHRRNSSVALYCHQSDGVFMRADAGIAISLLNMLISHPSFFEQSCYDEYAYSCTDINLFFKRLNIELYFPESSFTSSSAITSENDEVNIQSQESSKTVVVSFLREFRSDDPLALAIEIRNQEWASFDPTDKTSRANQESIITSLVNQGISRKQAESIELVSCPITR